MAGAIVPLGAAGQGLGALVPAGEAGGSPFLAVPAPPALDEYSEETEEKEYSRALLTTEELERLKAEVGEQGFLTIKQVRAMIAANTTSRFTGEGIYVLEPELVMQIDMRMNQPVFIMPDNTAMTRDELMKTYPFAEMRTTPEKIFAQQEVGVFPVRASNLDQSAKEYLARDAGSFDDLVMFEDILGREARKDYKDRRPLERVVKTKVFLAREGWEDFLALSKHIRALKRIIIPAAKAGEFSLGGPAAAPLSLEDAEGITKRMEQQEREMAEREERMRRQQEAFEARMRQQQEELEARTQKLTDLLAGL